jgi:5-formyltetrahydrofolate cyclo-ligase
MTHEPFGPSDVSGHESPEVLKRHMREEIDAKRKGLGTERRDSKSLSIAARLEELPEYAKASLPLLYIAMPAEVQTMPLVTDRLALGRSVAVPKVEEDRIEIYELRSIDHLSRGPWGILEPDPEVSPRADPGDVDAVLAPGVAFDFQGHRLGYGKAYYDRLLGHLRPGVSLIGLAFDLQIVAAVPVEAHDVPMNLVVTEYRVLDCAAARRTQAEEQSPGPDAG